MIKIFWFRRWAIFCRECWSFKFSHDVLPDASHFAVVFFFFFHCNGSWKPTIHVILWPWHYALKAYLLLRNHIGVLKITVPYFLVQLHLQGQTMTPTNQPGSHCFACTGGCAWRTTLPKGENYNCDAPLADSDFGKRAGDFVNLSITQSQSQFEAAKSSLKTETTKLLFVECISKNFLYSLFTNLAFPHWG